MSRPITDLYTNLLVYAQIAADGGHQEAAESALELAGTLVLLHPSILGKDNAKQKVIEWPKPHQGGLHELQPGEPTI